MVYEEKYVVRHNVPALQAVGWEGVFGFIILATLLVPMYYIPGGELFGQNNPRGKLEDALDGFVQLGNNGFLVMAVLGNIISIAFFNFAGISVTKELSATTRMVLDSVRTVVIWVFSMAVSWQRFCYIQLIGFPILFLGMCLYNEVIIVDGCRFLLRKVFGRISQVDSQPTNGATQHHRYVEVDADGDDGDRNPMINSSGSHQEQGNIL